MKSVLSLVWTVLLMLSVSLLAPPSLAYPWFQSRIPNGNNVPHPCKANYRWQGVGHLNPGGGGPRNVFGLAFKDAGYQWTTDLCRADTDEDGRTNGEELGDPDCVWSSGQVPPQTDGISHPGVCEPVDSEQCSGKSDFVECDLPDFTDCDRIEQPDVQNMTIRFTETSVPNTVTNYYCMSFDLPTDQDYHMVAVEAIIDNRDVMHHILLYGCPNAIDDEDARTPRPCGMSEGSSAGCGDLIATWTVGISGHCFASGTGFRFGASSYKSVFMQIHWNNPRRLRDYTDSSGLILYYQPATSDVEDLAIMWTGQRVLNIPPGLARDEEIGTCSSDCSNTLLSQPVNVVTVFNHMHYLGQSMTVEVYRGGAWHANLSYDEIYSYDSPVTHSHDPPIQLLPGDEIRTTCVFNSLSSSEYVHYGDATQDEMCYGFLTVYPAAALDKTTHFESFGPLDQCDLFRGTPVDGCNWRAFRNINNPTTQEYATQLINYCSPTGFCTSDCQEVHDVIAAHPCMQGEIGEYVADSLRRSDGGRQMLDLFHSCTDEEGEHSQICRLTSFLHLFDYIRCLFQKG